MVRGEKKLIDSILVDESARFDINVSYRVWLHEYCKIFGKSAPDKIKKNIKRVRRLWRGDEFLSFRILADGFLSDRSRCPQCGAEGSFIPGRYKKIAKLLDTGKPVRSERRRTVSCSECSFTFNPLSVTGYRNLKLDLRVWFFYGFISDDGSIDYPVSSISRILNVSYATAKRIKKFHNDGGRGFTDEEADKYVKKRGEDHAMIKILLDKYERDHKCH